MREYKFRGKRTGDGEWVHGCYSKCVEIGDNGYGEHMYRETHTVLHYILQDDGQSFIVYPETVGQFTELGELYEGDVIYFSVFDYNGADTQYKGVVKWANGMFEIWHDPESEYYGSDGAFVLSWVFAQDDEIEVIGNIYDNPKLMEVKK